MQSYAQVASKGVTPSPVPVGRSRLVLGIDIGGVLSAKGGVYERGIGAVSLMDVPGSLDALKKLKADGHKLVVVSYCGRARAKKTRDVLLSQYPDLFDDLVFVGDRKLKRNVCDREGIDVMVDDTLSILQSLRNNVIRIHFGSEQYPDWTSVYAKIQSIQHGQGRVRDTFIPGHKLY